MTEKLIKLMNDFKMDDAHKAIISTSIEMEVDLARADERAKVIDEVEKKLSPLTRYMRSIYRVDHSDGEELQKMLLERDVYSQFAKLKGKNE